MLDEKYHDDTYWIVETLTGRDMLTTEYSQWNPAEATEKLREMAGHPAFSLAYKTHATKRIAERGIIVSDLLYLLRNGFVLLPAVAATQVGYFKYTMQSVTPNSEGRIIQMIVIPNYENCSLKVVTVMWKDEMETRAGSIMEDVK